MILKKQLKKFLPKSVIDYYNSRSFSIEPFSYNENRSIVDDIKAKYHFDGDLAEIFATNNCFMVHKWHHYIPIYDKYFYRFRNKPVRILEIGVSEGGSLQMWRKYFGEQAVIYGVDINPECSRLNGLSGNVRIGSQVDAEFLNRVVSEMGGIDIVIDDGSHHMKLIPTTLEILFPQLSEGGLYLIEDLHTSYWPGFGGGFKARDNFFNYVRLLIDGMHAWYHRKSYTKSVVSKECTGIHVHDSIVVLEKSYPISRPTHSKCL